MSEAIAAPRQARAPAHGPPEAVRRWAFDTAAGAAPVWGVDDLPISWGEGRA